ncbi:MAG: transposase [Bacteroidales bacterium]
MTNNLPIRKSIRWKEHAYDDNHLYFITICSSNKQKIFSEVINEQIVLSPIGEVIQKEWNRSFDLRDELTCPLFCIMPNHIHAIISIEGNKAKPADQILLIRPKSISSFVIGFKSAVTSILKQSGFTQPVWQRNYYDRVIRDYNEYREIENYIIQNPAKWNFKEEI